MSPCSWYCITPNTYSVAHMLVDLLILYPCATIVGAVVGHHAMSVEGFEDDRTTA